jgi:protein-tyrosine phosphatase
MEFIPNQLPTGLFERIFELRCKGILPVLAHPERYSPLWKAPDTVEKLASDCAMVVDLGALSGHHGRKQAKYARKMVLSGIAHAAASDLHSPDDLRGAAEGIAWIHKKAGADAVQRLLATNPAKILEGTHPEG